MVSAAARRALGAVPGLVTVLRQPLNPSPGRLESHLTGHSSKKGRSHSPPSLPFSSAPHPVLLPPTPPLTPPHPTRLIEAPLLFPDLSSLLWRRARRQVSDPPLTGAPRLCSAAVKRAPDHGGRVGQQGGTLWTSIPRGGQREGWVPGIPVRGLRQEKWSLKERPPQTQAGGGEGPSLIWVLGLPTPTPKQGCEPIRGRGFLGSGTFHREPNRGVAAAATKNSQLTHVDQVRSLLPWHVQLPAEVLAGAVQGL